MDIDTTFSEEELILYQFAYMGAEAEKKPQIQKEIYNRISHCWQVQTVSWRQASDTLKDFWNTYKVEIIAGAEAATLLATTVAATAATGGTYAILGGAGVYCALNTIRLRLEQERGELPARSLEDPPSWEPVFISKNFEIPGYSLKYGAIGGIAGINTSQLENEVYATNFHHMANQSHIYWTYNQSHGIAIDVLETWLLNYHGISAPAKLLLKNWKKFHKKHKDNPDAKFLQICHSQGASHVRNALELAPLEIREKVIILAIAPAEVVPQKLCHASYNYASKRDIVYYGKILSHPDKLKENLKNLEELIFLEPDESAPLFDHAFQSPTFEKIIQKHVQDFILQYG
jgi:hypothetical protein